MGRTFKIKNVEGKKIMDNLIHGKKLICKNTWHGQRFLLKKCGQNSSNALRTINDVEISRS